MTAAELEKERAAWEKSVTVGTKVWVADLPGSGGTFGIGGYIEKITPADFHIKVKSEPIMESLAQHNRDTNQMVYHLRIYPSESFYKRVKEATQ